MNQNKKTGLFAVVGLAMLAVGVAMAWPRSTTNDKEDIAGTQLFEKFTDPLAAANLRVVTYDSEQAKLKPFEVRRDAESGLWTIPSRNGYPADAVEQMTEAANAFVGLKILDVQTDKAELHDDLGVLEPKLDDLKGGEDGVGRLVTFKDASEKTLASLIIGYPVKDEDGKIYVRKPGEDPVYVVKMDDSPLTTKFQDWIEEDLLQLSSIEIKEMQIKDYTAALGMDQKVALDRSFEARVSIDGQDWKIDELLQYNPSAPQADPTPVELAEGSLPNADKLNEMKDALDDLKIVDVLKKPAGMSESLKADATLVSGQEAFQSLILKGFFPIGNEVLSANGEMTVSLNDGVQYSLRFGNVTGLSEESTGDDESGNELDNETPTTGGVNRYMLVTTMVDETIFPIPDLEKKPETLEDLEAIMNAKKQAETVDQAAIDDAEEPVKAVEDPAPAPVSNDDAEESEMQEDAPGAVAEEDAAEEPLDEPSGETTVEGESDGSVSGNGLDENEDDAAAKTTGEPAAGESAVSDAAAATAAEVQTADVKTDGATAAEEGRDASYEDLTSEEKQELLQAEQEKIMKANQRKLDARNEKIDAAKQRVQELNARFADWYYVIPETTYRQLRVTRDELVKTPEQQTDPNAVIQPDGTMPTIGDAPSFGTPDPPTE